MTAACCYLEAATRVSPDYPNHHSGVPCPLPGRIAWVRVSIASPLVQPSPNGRRVGIRIVTFEACSGFTRVTARRIAQPPKVTPAFARPGSLSRGSGPASYPAKPLVSFRTYRQLSGWNPPPLMIRAFRAHCQDPTSVYNGRGPDPAAYSVGQVQEEFRLADGSSSTSIPLWSFTSGCS